jgi:hypothetical protein
MAEILYGNPIDYKRFAADTSLPVRFAEEVINLHAGRGSVSTAPPQKAPDAGRLYQLSGKERTPGSQFRSEEGY